MKILFTLTPPFNPNSGGVQRTTYKLGKYFTEQGYDVGYFSLANEGHVKAEYGDLFVVSENGKHKNSNNLQELKNVLTSFKPDIVINQMPYETELRNTLVEGKKSLGYLLLGCLRNSLFSVKNNLKKYREGILPSSIAPWFNNNLGHNILLLSHWFKHRKQLKTILDDYDYFVLLTPPNEEELKYFVGNYKENKVTAIPNSIPFINNTATVVKEKTILHVGRLNDGQKRSDLLLPFWKMIYQQLPDWEFIIVGDGPYKNNIENQIKEEEIPRVKLVGYQKPEPFYEKASIFVMPSGFEGFPNVLLEAQSYGLVPVCYDSYPALSWIVNNNKDAFFVPPYDLENFGQKVLEIARDDELFNKMSHKAYFNAEHFTIDKVGKQWETFFNQTITRIK